jgi:Bacteriocin-protection, YdeI or OmpD-Associated/Domain of unknown function (DUF1905)
MKSFKARIDGIGPGEAWSRIRLPFDAEKEYGTRGRVSVKVTLGKDTFHTSIFPNGDGSHHLMFNKAMQKASGAGAGDTIVLKMERDRGEEPEIPPALAAALKKNAKASAIFKALTPACRREYSAWIGSAKREETKVDRSAKAVTMILAGKKRPSD